MAFSNKKGQGSSEDVIFAAIESIAADLAALKAAFLGHRHSVAGGASTGTAPSTEAAAAGATASTVAIGTTSE